MLNRLLILTNRVLSFSLTRTEIQSSQLLFQNNTQVLRQAIRTTSCLLSMSDTKKKVDSIQSMDDDDEKTEELILKYSDAKEQGERIAGKIENLTCDNPDQEDDDEEILGELRESYLAAQRECASKWLDYNKSCYVYLYRGGSSPSSSLAAFDLDGTLIKPKSNKRIPKSATDWTLFSVWTKVKLQQVLREKQASLVIFTNQNGVGLNIVPLEEVQERVELVTKRLNIPCSVFVAVNKDQFRKPQVGMFRLFRKSFNGSHSIDKTTSFYCGDAVGYPSHSDADIMFAKTLRLPFLAPEKFLRGVKPKLVEEKD